MLIEFQRGARHGLLHNTGRRFVEGWLFSDAKCREDSSQQILGGKLPRNFF